MGELSLPQWITLVCNCGTIVFAILIIKDALRDKIE
jgi:hypothetical protein